MVSNAIRTRNSAIIIPKNINNLLQPMLRTTELGVEYHMKALEQAVADKFNDYMRDFCRYNGKTFQPLSLGGQDRDSADYLISSAEGFALIEFKHSETELTKEGKNSRKLLQKTRKSEKYTINVISSFGGIALAKIFAAHRIELKFATRVSL